MSRDVWVPTRGSADFERRHRAQMRTAERWLYESVELDAREDECWRMYGADVLYCMDERVILSDASVKGMDSMMGALL